MLGVRLWCGSPPPSNGELDNGWGLAVRWALVIRDSPSISPGAGTEGSFIWRFIITWDWRRPALEGWRFRLVELLEEPGGRGVSETETRRGRMMGKCGRTRGRLMLQAGIHSSRGLQRDRARPRRGARRLVALTLLLLRLLRLALLAGVGRGRHGAGCGGVGRERQRVEVWGHRARLGYGLVR